MLDFTPKKPARNWTSRREQRRLLILVALAAGVIVAASMAREPRLYHWIADIGKDKTVEDAHIDTRVPPKNTPADLRAGFLAISADAPADVPADVPPGDRFPGVRLEYFRAIKDSAIHRPEESEAWFHLLDIANKTPQEALERASRGRVTFMQLFRQPDAYRAELVTVAGTIRRVVPQKITANYVGLEGEYYQIWLEPKNSIHPVVVYALALPEGFPIGADLKEPAEVTGFFYKVWAYPAQDQPRTAPILLAKTLRWNEEWVKRAFDRPAVAPAVEKPVPAAKQSPRDYLAENWEFTDEVWKRFADGRAVPPASASRDDEPATMLKLLNNLPRLPTATVEAWTDNATAAATLVDKPAEHRGAFFAIAGRAVRCERVAVPEDLGKLFDFETVYRTEIRPDDAGPARMVYSSAAPRGWLRGPDGQPLDAHDIDEQATTVGMFVKRGADVAAGTNGEARPSLVFVARRLSWQSTALLGRLGMDMALFDDLTQNAEIAGEESECLYSLLGIAPRIDRDELNELAREHQFALQKDFEYDYPYPNIPSNSFILNEVRSRPEQSAGIAASLTATALRAFRIQLSAEDAAKYGFDHYYHVDASVPLEPPITIVQRRKEAGPAKADASADAPKTKETRRDYMNVVICLRRLPDGFPQGEKINEQICVPGFFFKTWAASSTKSAKVDPRSRNQYPMFIADALIWYAPVEEPSWLGGAIVGVLVGMLVLGGIGALIARRGNRTLDQTLARQRTETDAPLDSLDIEASGKPDFGFLANERVSPPEASPPEGSQASPDAKSP